MSNFSGMKVAELKEELSLRGLSTSGKKADLLERVGVMEGDEHGRITPLQRFWPGTHNTSDAPLSFA